MASRPTFTRENRLATMTATSASNDRTAGFTRVMVTSDRQPGGPIVPYATEAELHAALTAYRAFHPVFYRFYKSAHHPPVSTPDRPDAPKESIATAEQDYRNMLVELLPALARTYGGPRCYVERLDETLMQLGVQHASTPQFPFDRELTNQAYVDVDNILESLLCERANFPAAFDEAFSGSNWYPGAMIVRPPK